MKQVSLYLLIKNVLIIYGGENDMKDVVVDKAKGILIEEKEYQEIKKKLNKIDDYFSEEELNNRRNLGVIYIQK